MKSVFKLSSNRVALAAAFGLVACGFTPAEAADLGGNCCADLEERIAELEATTARKGNRKVSLTVSGWVNEAVFFWDDGTERNVYVGTNGLEQSRFRFTGEAKIMNDWSAGYTLEIGVVGAASNTWDQIIDDGNTKSALTVRKSNWYLKSNTYGKVTVGLEGTATYHLLDDADATNTRNFSDAEAAAVAQGRFFLRSNGNGVGGGAFGTGLRWSDILVSVNNGTPGQNGRRNIVRYDSPELHGFVVTASWGEDDMGGVSLTYKNVWGDFKVLAKAGFEHNSDENTSVCSQLAGQDCSWGGAAATIMHVPTGLYVYGGFGRQHDDTEAEFNPLADPTDKMWFIQAGIEQKFCPLGTTTIFGEFRHDDAGSNLAKNPTGLAGDFVEDSDLNFVAAGVVQNIEAAAMDLYVIYRHADGDVNAASGTEIELDPFDMVITGALIKF